MTGPLFTTSRLPAQPQAINWPLLPLPDGDGRLSWPDEATSVRQSIEIILRTGPGELLMRERFGAGLEQMLNRPNTVATRAELQRTIRDAISRHEPRVLLDEVSIAETSDSRRVDVTIAYRILPRGQAVRLRAAVELGGA